MAAQQPPAPRIKETNHAHHSSVPAVGREGAFVLYAILGLVGGMFFAAFSMLGTAIGASRNDGSALFGPLFGVGAVIFFPILYGGLGALFAPIMSAFYNVVAGFVGGIELTVEPLPQPR